MGFQDTGLWADVREMPGPLADTIDARAGVADAAALLRGDGVRRAFITDPDDHIVELIETGVEVTGDEPALYGPGHPT